MESYIIIFLIAVLIACAFLVYRWRRDPRIDRFIQALQDGEDSQEI